MLTTLVLFASLHAAPPAADSLAGRWQITGEVVGSPLDELCTLTQSGEKLTGSCKNDQGGPYDVTGEVKDGKITFRHGGDYQGQALTITYTGTLAAPKSLKGTVEVQPFGVSGTFAAAPAAPDAKP